jgi:hypothetical protein
MTAHEAIIAEPLNYCDLCPGMQALEFPVRNARTQTRLLSKKSEKRKTHLTLSVPPD